MDRNNLKNREIKRKWYLFLLLLLASCTPYQVREHKEPQVTIPESFYHEQSGKAEVSRWWEEFENNNLNQTVTDAIDGNLQVKQIFYRLQQAQKFIQIDQANLYPALEIRSGANYTRFVDDDFQNNQGGFGGGVGGIGGFGNIGTIRQNTQRYFLNASLSYEIDIWSRFSSQIKSSQLQYLATAEDTKQTILLLSGQIVDLWLVVAEQQETLSLLDKQISVALTLLELTELRFSLGRGSALDVLQQRQQVAALKSQIPLIRNNLQTTLQQIAVLQGKNPHELLAQQTLSLPNLPDAPKLISPRELIENRPDLKAALLQLQAAEYAIAVAVADRLPRIVISPSYELATARFSTFFHQEILSLAANLVAPVFDGGRRVAEVERRKAIVEELLAVFGDLYLRALLEIENALVSEKRQLEFIKELENQINLAKKTLDESKARYMNGLNDYLTVIFALQTLQNLERQMINEKRQLLAIRSQLYRALGGNWSTESFDTLQKKYGSSG